MISNTQNNCLVFCHFKEEMNLIEKSLKQRRIGVEMYHGGMNGKKRLEVLNKFPNNDMTNTAKLVLNRYNIPEVIQNQIFSYSPRVLLIQINAGGVGLNLQQFSEVYFPSPDWNPSNEIQALARAHRLGQVKPVTVHRFILFDQEEEFSTIDQRIGSIQVTKRNLMAKILEDDNLLRDAKLSYKDIKTTALIQKISKQDYHTLLG
jgi:SNF2 family DNA or RNA helicase